MHNFGLYAMPGLLHLLFFTVFLQCLDLRSLTLFDHIQVSKCILIKLHIRSRLPANWRRAGWQRDCAQWVERGHR